MQRLPQHGNVSILGVFHTPRLWHRSLLLPTFGKGGEKMTGYDVNATFGFDFVHRSDRVGTVVSRSTLEVWPESHWPGFTLRQADVFQSYTAW